MVGLRAGRQALLGSVNSTRYSAGDTNTNSWGRGMGACAWVLERNERPPGRDAWAVACDVVRVGGGACGAEHFWVAQNRLGPVATLEKPMQIKNLPPRAPAGVGALDQRVAV